MELTDITPEMLEFIQQQEPSYKATLKVPDRNAINLLKNWAKNNIEYISDEINLQNVFSGLTAYYHNEIISKSVLNRIPKIFSEFNRRSNKSNENIFLSSFNYAVLDLRSTFTEYFTADDPTAFTVKKVTKSFLIKQLRKAYKARLDQINAERKAKAEHPNKIKEITCLSESGLASLLLRYIPMFKTKNTEDTMLCIYDFDKGIYDTNDLYLGELVDKLDSQSSERMVYNVRYKLILRTQVKVLEENKYLYPVQNGIYDKRNQKLTPYSPAFRYITQVATPYDRNAQEPRYELQNGEFWTPTNFIKDLACNDPEIEHLLYEVIDDSVNGSYSREQAIFLLGKKNGGLSHNGSNGKGTYQDLIQAIAGEENTAHLRADVMNERFAINGLLGKTVNIGDDLQANTYIADSSNFNGAVSGDALHADVKNKKAIEFRFKGAMIQSTNDLPSFKNKTGGTYRRMVIVPFNAHFNASEDGKNIKSVYIKTIETRKWFLKKALEMPFFSEFTVPTKSKQLIDDFKTDNDTIRLFVNEEMSNIPIARIGGKPLYKLYQDWSERNGYKRPYVKQQFTKQVSGVLLDDPENIQKITMQQFDDIATNKDNREKLINKILPIFKCDFEYSNRATTKEYSNYSSGDIDFFSKGQDRAYCFSIRELLCDTLEVFDSLPKKDSPEFEKQNNKLKSLQSKLIE